ncbi:hypothetical protein V8C34DRAFT_141507 [Trichoderma compactum]
MVLRRAFFLSASQPINCLILPAGRVSQEDWQINLSISHLATAANPLHSINHDRWSRHVQGQGRGQGHGHGQGHGQGQGSYVGEWGPCSSLPFSQTHPDSPKGPLMKITCTLHHYNNSAVLRLLQVLVRRLRVWDMYPTGTRTPPCTDGVLPEPCHVAHGEQMPSASSLMHLCSITTPSFHGPLSIFTCSPPWKGTISWHVTITNGTRRRGRLLAAEVVVAIIQLHVFITVSHAPNVHYTPSGLHPVRVL